MNDLNLNSQLQSNTSPLNNTDTGNLSNMIDRLTPGASLVGPYANQRAYTVVVRLNDPKYNNLQPAINEVNRVGGGVVFVKPGTYIQSASIQMYSNVQVVGEDDNTTKISFGTAARQIVGTSLSNISFNNIGLADMRATSLTFGAFNLASCNDVSIQSCRFASNWNSGTGADIYVSAGTNFTISGNKFVSSGNNIVGGITDGNISNNYFGTSSGIALNLALASRLRVVGNSFDSCGSFIMNNSGSISNISFVGNTVSNHQVGAFYFGTTPAEYMSFVGNQFTGSASSGIAFFGTCDGAGIGFRRSSITANTFEGFGSHAIQFFVTAHVAVTGNIFRNMGGWGVRFDTTTASNILMCNSFFNNGAGGTQHYIDVSGNNIVSNIGDYNVT